MPQWTSQTDRVGDRTDTHRQTDRLTSVRYGHSLLALFIKKQNTKTRRRDRQTDGQTDGQTDRDKKRRGTNIRDTAQ